jgi:hypothetical protein
MAVPGRIDAESTFPGAFRLAKRAAIKLDPRLSAAGRPVGLA